MNLLHKYFKGLVLPLALLFVVTTWSFTAIAQKNIDSTKSFLIVSGSSKLNEGQKKIAQAFKTIDTSRIIKRNPATSLKNLSKSALDPDALSVGSFKVSKKLYGVYAEYIVDYVKNYHKNFGPRMTRVKSNNKGYFTMIDNVMRKNKIPTEMHSLAVIESALNPNAVSGVGATGPWQFMGPTAEMLGLVVTEELDERRDFYKSTHAAAKYVRRLHNMFHDWLLVIAAYNCGPAPVLRNLNKTGGHSFWDIKKFLPAETQNHVMAFIATSVYYDKNSKVLDLGNTPRDAQKLNTSDLGKQLAKNKKTKKEEKIIEKEDDLAIDEKPEEFNPQQILPEEVSQIITLKIKGAFNIESIASKLIVDLNKLRRWNPLFNEQAAAQGSLVKLTIPSAKLEAFLIEKDEILKLSLKNPNYTSGNTVYVGKTGPSGAKVNTTNNVVINAPIPSKISSPIIVSKVVASTTNENGKVAPKLNNIDNRKNITPEPKKVEVVKKDIAPLKADKKDIEKIENFPVKSVTAVEQKTMEKNTIYKVVKNNTVAKETGKIKKGKNGKKYITIEKGDNLTEIAETFGMTVARLMELNKLKKPVIMPGQFIYLE